MVGPEPTLECLLRQSPSQMKLDVTKGVCGSGYDIVHVTKQENLCYHTIGDAVTITIFMCELQDVFDS